LKFQIVLGNWATLAADAQAVRYEVFIIEQGIPIELEWDDIDGICIHAVVYDEHKQPIGTGRLLPDGHIGRMAVRKAMRRIGIGGAILTSLMQHAKNRGDKAVILNAQNHAESFYAHHGFNREGAEFIEAAIPHILMRHVFS
jgi:predicted GNAT family N-acyltransferase